MTAQSPSAYAASAGLHALAIALIVLSAYYLNRNAEDPPQIFELVGGVGDNYAATEAPAAGEPGAAGTDRVVLPPSPVVRTPDPEPIAPPPPPMEAVVAPPAPEPLPIKAIPPAKTLPTPEPKPIDVGKNITRLMNKRTANIEKKFKAEQKAKADRERKEAEAAAKRAVITKADFDKANKAAKTPSTSATNAKVPSVAAGIRGGMVGATGKSTAPGAGGTAMERAEADLMSAYLSLITQRIKRTMEEANFGDELSVRIQFTVSSSGLISGAKVVGTSGSGDFDRAVVEALQSTPNLGPPPNGKSGTYAALLKMSDGG